MKLRRTGTTSAALLVGLALSLLFAHKVAPDWVKRLGLDVWNFSDAANAKKNAGQEAAALEERSEQLFKELDFSDHICELLIAGKISLDEAVDEMEPYLGKRPGFDQRVQKSYGVSSFRQCVARYLIQKTARNMSDEIPAKTIVLDRLEGEYACLKA